MVLVLLRRLGIAHKKEWEPRSSDAGWLLSRPSFLLKQCAEGSQLCGAMFNLGVRICESSEFVVSADNSVCERLKRAPSCRPLSLAYSTGPGQEGICVRSHFNMIIVTSDQVLPQNIIGQEHLQLVDLSTISSHYPVHQLP